jgi:hypothetical protein
MVITPATAKINLEVLPYFKGKGSQINQATAKAVEQPNHAEMVEVLTGFIDKLIQSGVEKLEAAARDGSNTEAQVNLDKYKADAPVASFKGEVADKLAQNIYAVKQLLIEGGLAEYKDNQDLIFKIKDTKVGQSIAFDSAEKLAEQALQSVNDKLLGYGININNEEADNFKKTIIQELKSPPKPRSETPAAETPSADATSDTKTASTANPSTTTSTSPENPSNSIIDVLKEQQSQIGKELLSIPAIHNFISQRADQKKNQESGISLLHELNKRIGKELNALEDPAITGESALETFKANLAENTEFIATHLGKNSFPKAFDKLTEDKKIQVGMLLKNLEITVDQDTMVNLTGKITRQLGENTKQNLQAGLTNLINEQDQSKKPASSSELNMGKVNERLKEYNQALNTIKEKNLPTPRVIEEKQKATANFLTNIHEDLKNNQLSPEDVKVIQDSIGLTEKERNSGKASPAIDNILGRFINPLKEQCERYGITTEDLKQFAGTTAALAIGAAFFCPNLVPGLAQGVFSLGAMMTQTIIPLYNNMTQANITRTLAGKAQGTH